ncbi:hypothetical protein [Rhizobium laguerreae]|uniref:hypothetical protein n=1 Tax=Rhizobium laguerreae TaxID=1076926 RepID=UPI001C91A83E|nr:hypothetical protein [Rhizobium laguerreae]MBY3434838.1 hypothetical protein [Rhizobium laguerreae]MBY3448981.1 hypothetical protein [Rhizobium laguerreae]MBY3456755.1 hypothetical protein [Rhizobium laguerreae]
MSRTTYAPSPKTSVHAVYAAYKASYQAANRYDEIEALVSEVFSDDGLITSLLRGRVQ